MQYNGWWNVFSINGHYAIETEVCSLLLRAQGIILATHLETAQESHIKASVAECTFRMSEKWQQ